MFIAFVYADFEVVVDDDASASTLAAASSRDARRRRACLRFVWICFRWIGSCLEVLLRRCVLAIYARKESQLMRLMRKAKKKLTHQECNDLSHHLVLQQSIVIKILRDRIAHVVHTTYIVAKNGKQNSGEFMIHNVAESHSILNQ